MEKTQGVHDIHNPPKERYIHQEYPKVMYCEPKEGQHPHLAHKVVKDADEHKAAVDAGYQDKPFEFEAGEEGSNGVAEEPKQENPAAKPRGRKKKAEESAE